MASWRQCISIFGALVFPLTVAPLSLAQSGSADIQSGVVIFWNAAQCIGGYNAGLSSAHCYPGPIATILDVRSKMQFFCVDNEAVDIR